MFPKLLFVAGWFLLQAPDNLNIERVAAKCAYAEGPLWSREGFLLYTDALNNRIYKLAPHREPELFRDNSGGAMGLTYDTQGRLYICESRARRVTRLDKKGKLDVLADAWQGKKLNAPNDIVVRKDGNAYFTDPAFGYQLDNRELDFYGVYRINPKGELSLAAKWTTRPNGIALSPNGRTLYVADSDARTIRAYDIDKDGSPTNERIFVSKIEGIPGGLRVDEKGSVYLAAKQIFIYDTNGKQIHSINMTDAPSNLTWGDSDFSSLYVTLRTEVFRIHLDAKGSVQY